MNNKQLKVLDNSLMQNGVEEILLVCMEESSELIKAITKAERYPGQTTKIDNIVEEVADVLICIEYLKMIYNIDQEEIESWKKKKIKRLKERMDSER